MGALVRFETEDGSALLVEVDDDAFGVERVARHDNVIIEAGQKLEDVIATAQTTIRAVVDGLRKLAPDEHEIEFGLKLNAEAGVLVAKTAMEGHFTVKLAWRGATRAAGTP
jgi:Trypsin-co-occurring domain 1